MNVLGIISPDPVGVVLETGFERFVSPTGIEGLARAIGGRLDVLAVINPTPIRGCFGKFIAAAQIEYRTICVFAIDNPIVDQALRRYGFTDDVEIDRFGDTQELLRWDKP